MTDLRPGPKPSPWSEFWAGVNAGQHLALDAIVAFVDGELSLGAHERAAAHVAGCAMCANEVAAQRQARSAVRGADVPSTPAGLLAALQAIPQRAEVSPPHGLVMTRDGQVVPMTGDVPAGTEPLSGKNRDGANGLGASTLNGMSRRGVGFLISGLVLGAAVLAVPVATAVDRDDVVPPAAEPATSSRRVAPPPSLQAHFDAGVPPSLDHSSAPAPPPPVELPAGLTPGPPAGPAQAPTAGPSPVPR